MTDRVSITAHDGRLVYVGRSPYGDRFANFRTMFEAARQGFADFGAKRREVLSDDSLSDLGKRRAIDALIRDFDSLRERFRRGPVANRLPEMEKTMAALRGSKPRETKQAANSSRFPTAEADLACRLPLPAGGAFLFAAAERHLGGRRSAATPLGGPGNFRSRIS